MKPVMKWGLRALLAPVIVLAFALVVTGALVVLGGSLFMAAAGVVVKVALRITGDTR